MRDNCCHLLQCTKLLLDLNWMGYSGSYMLLPIYMQEARGVDIGLVGVVVFVRPLVGSLVSAMLARGNTSRGREKAAGAGAPRWFHNPRRLAQLGAVGGPPSYLIYYFMYYESSEAQLIPSLVVALIIQGASCFTMSINCNTIVCPFPNLLVLAGHSCYGPNVMVRLEIDATD
eukprot:COSAG02_NODE_10615_length_1900_cov_1.505275_3_plen_173_part_00